MRYNIPSNSDVIIIQQYTDRVNRQQLSCVVDFVPYTYVEN